MNTTSEIKQKLSNPDYRAAFIASQISIGIPFQIRSIMKSRGWTQAELSQRAGMRQPSISGLMTPGKVKPNIETLRRLAKAFDCGLSIRFVPFSEVVGWLDKFDPDRFEVPSFAEEQGAVREEQGRLITGESLRPLLKFNVSDQAIRVNVQSGVTPIESSPKFLRGPATEDRSGLISKDTFGIRGQLHAAG